MEISNSIHLLFPHSHSTMVSLTITFPYSTCHEMITGVQAVKSTKSDAWCKDRLSKKWKRDSFVLSKCKCSDWGKTTVLLGRNNLWIDASPRGWEQKVVTQLGLCATLQSITMLRPWKKQGHKLAMKKKDAHYSESRGKLRQHESQMQHRTAAHVDPLVCSKHGFPPWVGYKKRINMAPSRAWIKQIPLCDYVDFSSFFFFYKCICCWYCWRCQKWERVKCHFLRWHVCQFIPNVMLCHQASLVPCMFGSVRESERDVRDQRLTESRYVSNLTGEYVVFSLRGLRSLSE